MKDCRWISETIHLVKRPLLALLLSVLLTPPGILFGLPDPALASGMQARRAVQQPAHRAGKRSRVRKLGRDGAQVPFAAKGLPPGWIVVDREANGNVAPEMPWRIGRRNYEVVSANDGSQARWLIVYDLSKGKWRILSLSRAQIMLSLRGTYFTQNQRLYTIDCIFENNLANGADQPYVLHVYTIRTGHLKCIFRATTRRSYPDIEDRDPRPSHIPVSEDPLREFGLRWH